MRLTHPECLIVLLQEKEKGGDAEGEKWSVEGSLVRTAGSDGQWQDHPVVGGRILFQNVSCLPT